MGFLQHAIQHALESSGAYHLKELLGLMLPIVQLGFSKGVRIQADSAPLLRCSLKLFLCLALIIFLKIGWLFW